jgi:hypothetical protein
VAERQEGDTGAGQRDERDVARAARGRERHAERAEELDRDRHPERDAVDRLEERERQDARAHAEGDRGTHVPGGAVREPRLCEGPQDQRGRDEAQRDDPGGPDPVEQRLRERRPELEHAHRRDGEPDPGGNSARHPRVRACHP